VTSACPNIGVPAVLQYEIGQGETNMEAMHSKQYVLQTNKQTNRDTHAHTHALARAKGHTYCSRTEDTAKLPLTNVSPAKEDKLRYSAGLTNARCFHVRSI